MKIRSPHRLCLAIHLFLLLFAAAASAQSFSAEEIAGIWWSPKKDARIELYRAGRKVMGRVVWAIPERRDLLDAKNPDKGLRNRRIVGSTIFSDFVYAEGRWVDGKIYDPESGRTYSCTMELVDANTLSVHGYVGIPILGRSEKFTRFHGEKTDN